MSCHVKSSQIACESFLHLRAFRLHKFSYTFSEVMNEAAEYYANKGRRDDLLPRVLDPVVEASFGVGFKLPL